MSTATKEAEQVQCPQCDSILGRHAETGQLPSFCLQCRFPVMLVAGKYRLTSILGEGGFGTVYEATHINMTRDPKRVVKILKPEVIAKANMRERFAREVQVTSALSQKNHHIVRVYDDFGEIPNLGMFYVMEHLEGNPLSTILDETETTLPLEQCYHYFLQLCTAMHDAHEEGIVHRDLKPENILIVKHLRDPNHLKVIDFGIAKPLGTEKHITNASGGMLGTPAYMAPEQLSKQIGSHVDIYAMGVILYEMLVGTTPFTLPDGSARSAPEIIAAKLMETPPPANTRLPKERHIPDALSAVLDTALARTPEQRFPSVEALEEAFKHAIEEPQPIVLTSKTTPPPITPVPASQATPTPTPSPDPPATPPLNMNATLPYALEIDDLLPQSLQDSHQPTEPPPDTPLPLRPRHTPTNRKTDPNELMQQLLKMEVKDAHTLDPMLYAEQHGIDGDTDFEDEEYLQAAFAPTLDAPLEDVAGTIVDPVPPIKKRSSATRWILLSVGFVALGLLGGYWIQTQRQTTNTHIAPQPIRRLQPTYAPQKGRPNGTTKLAPSPQRTHAPVHRGRTHRE